MTNISEYSTGIHLRIVPSYIPIARGLSRSLSLTTRSSIELDENRKSGSDENQLPARTAQRRRVTSTHPSAALQLFHTGFVLMLLVHFLLSVIQPALTSKVTPLTTTTLTP
jgi:hypothetical protein